MCSCVVGFLCVWVGVLVDWWVGVLFLCWWVGGPTAAHCSAARAASDS